MSATPGQPAPAPKSPRRELFLLFYRFGNVPSIQKAFDMPEGSTLMEAIVRGREHCARMNYRFLYVQKFVHNLEEDETRKSTRDEIPQTLEA